MGVASSAVFGLLFLFAVGALGLLSDAALRAQRDYAEATEEAADHAQAQGAGALEVVRRAFSNPGGPGTPGRLELWVNNTGGTVFDAGLVDVLLDGLVRNDKVTQRTVAGLATDIWAPGEELYLRLDDLPATAPARAWVVAETGAAGVG